MLYTIAELRRQVNKLLIGNSKVIHLEQMKDIFERNNIKVIEVEEGKYQLIKVWEV